MFWAVGAGWDDEDWGVLKDYPYELRWIIAHHTIALANGQEVGVPSFHDVYETINHDKAVDAFAKTAFLKLNGGLGTSMGLDCAKSLLPVRRHKARQMRFIDIIIGQVLTARTRLGVELPLTLMNSFRKIGRASCRERVSSPV